MEQVGTKKARQLGEVGLKKGSVMGWERRRGRLFYYRKQRDEQGRVRSIYVGRGEAAVRLSLADGVSLPDDPTLPVVLLPEVTDIRGENKKDVAEIGDVESPDDHPVSSDWLARLRARRQTLGNSH